MTTAILKKWVTDTLKNSIEYQDFCISLIGSTLNYYRSAPMNDIVETLPYFTVYGDTYEEDDLSQDSWNQIWQIPIAIAVEAVEKSIDDNGVKVWETPDKVEQLAIKARDILKKESFGCGISGESINVIKTHLMVSEIGEADDVQASMYITFGKLNLI